jgi:hypothetical protein
MSSVVRKGGIVSRSIHRPSAALVIACLALFVALADAAVGTVSQLIAPNSVGTVQLRNGAVTTSKLRDGAVTSPKVRDHSLRAVDFAQGLLPGSSGVTGYEIVSGQNVVTNAFIHNSLFLRCPAGKKALGGGGATGGGIVPGDGPYITSSLASVDGTGWLIDTTRANPGASTLVGRVICANVS